MGTSLETLQPPPGHRKRRKRVGRGYGSGRGKTSTRGHKGQRARNTVRQAFEGGQNPIHRRVPKRGFVHRERVEAFGINVGRLESAFEGGDTVDVNALRQRGLVPKKATRIKLLGEGEISKKLTIRIHQSSKSATEKISSVGGAVELICAKIIVE